MTISQQYLREKYGSLATEELLELWKRSELTELESSVLVQILKERGVFLETLSELASKEEKEAVASKDDVSPSFLGLIEYIKQFEPLETEELVEIFRNGELNELALSALSEVIEKRGISQETLNEIIEEKEKKSIGIEEKRKKRWFFPVVTTDDAHDAIKIAYQTAFVLSGIQAVVLIIVSLLSGHLSGNVLDPIFMAALALSMKSRPSRLAATVLLGYSLVIGATTQLARLGSPITDFGGKNIILAALFIFAGYKGLQGTFGYHRLHGTKIRVRNVVKLALIIFGYVLGMTVVYFGLFSVFITAFDEMSYELIGLIWFVLLVALIFLGCLGWLPGTGRIQITQAPEDTGDDHSGDRDMFIMSLSEKEVEKVPPGLCLSEGCQEESIFEGRFCWEHLPKEQRKKYILKIERDAKAGKDLSDANFRLVDFSGAKSLFNVNLSGAKLSSANLSEANLSGINLIGTNLSHTNLSGADLSKANLSYANLSEANLSDANVSHAKFYHSKISGAEPMEGANPHTLWKQILGLSIVTIICIISFRFGGILLALAGVFTFIDAWKAGIYKNKGVKSFLNISPMGWGIAMEAFIIVSYPLYLINRNKLKTKDGENVFWILTIIFGGITILSLGWITIYLIVRT